ncbi:MAG: outer membrane beta-barrel protein [Granulicella sp.]
MLKALIALTLAATGTGIVHAQALPTATRLAEAQVGVTYVNGRSDYSQKRFNGFGFYGDLDFRHGIGVEAAFHYMSDGQPKGIYERTYEIGGRYSRRYGRFQPYGKFMVGRGVFNFPGDQANLAYNLYAFGGGTDYRVLPFLNVRVDYEAQKWLSGPLLQNGLSPSLLSVGAAYHFK